MATIEWSSRFELGIPEIDEQHRSLIGLAGKFYEALASGSGVAEVGRTVEQLVDYALIHFSEEEKYFTIYNLPNFESHKAGHEEFIRTIGEFAGRIDSPKPALVNEVMLYLLSWIHRHIGEEDRVLLRITRRARIRAGISSEDDKAPPEDGERD